MLTYPQSVAHERWSTPNRRCWRPHLTQCATGKPTQQTWSVLSSRHGRSAVAMHKCSYVYTSRVPMTVQWIITYAFIWEKHQSVQLKTVITVTSIYFLWLFVIILYASSKGRSPYSMSIFSSSLYSLPSKRLLNVLSAISWN